MSHEPANSKRPIPAQTVFLLLVVALCCGAVVYVAVFHDRWGGHDVQAGTSKFRLEEIPFNGTRAYEYLKQLCAIGPRPSGSPGMLAEQKLLTDHFQKLWGKVELQRFAVPHPLDKSQVPMANLIVRWQPERKQRILFCAHYDTLPYPMMDPVNPKGTFIGANDGGSGVALLMEMGHSMNDLPAGYGVDFVFLDGEEFLFDPQGTYFLGSEYFARQYAQDRSGVRYRWGVLLDMVGDADLQIYQERNSMLWQDTRPLVDAIWRTARRLGVHEFVAQRKYEILDDHVPLHNIGRIPICDLIDFDYPSWHTQGDTADKCSALSLAKVGWVLRQWLSGLGRAADSSREPR